MKYELIPFGTNVYVKLNPVEEFVTESGVVVPRLHSEESRIGEVIAVGDKVRSCKVGDIVLVEYVIGMTIHLIAEGVQDDTHRIMNESQIACKIKEKE